MRFLTPALFLPFIFTRPSGTDAADSTGTSERCKPTPLPATPPSAVNIWAALTADETASIAGWLRGPARHLNLSSRASSISDNSIVLIESYPPSKAEALAHLLSPDTVAPPDRYARVTIHHGAASEPSVKDYIVGPLPISSSRKTRMYPLTDIYHAKVPYNARRMSLEAMDEEIMRNLLTPEMLSAIEAISGLANSNATFGIAPTTPMSFDGSFRRHWISFTQQVAGWTIRPVALYAYIDMSGTDASKWRILKVVCNNQLFNSTHEFLKAYHNGSLNRPAVPEHPNNSSWSSRKRREGYTRDLDDLPGPRSISSDGLRFRLDRERGYVSWMGWGMFLSFNCDMGMSLWDVRFRGERLIYELATIPSSPVPPTSTVTGAWAPPPAI
ncbi:hypothetical protein V5O48_016298 [Marasmius crinis-equi]|uniref:Amine oxidase n=1 Tax=Marasmius crinis-equi TaxID=585013 RepID=A0ABR3ES38_9AGAR